MSYFNYLKLSILEIVLNNLYAFMKNFLSFGIDQFSHTHQRVRFEGYSIHSIQSQLLNFQLK